MDLNQASLELSSGPMYNKELIHKKYVDIQITTYWTVALIATPLKVFTTKDICKASVPALAKKCCKFSAKKTYILY